jgi:hypothetical protein
MCPVEPETLLSDEATWSNVWNNILRPSCGGAGCHVDQLVGNLDMRTEEAAYRDLSRRIVPGDPVASLLYQRLSPDLCLAPGCQTMPSGRWDRPETGRTDPSCGGTKVARTVRPWRSSFVS